MKAPIRYLYRGGCGEIIEKKSRFIATIEPVTTEDEAAAFVERIRKQYWDARHNCTAMILGNSGELTRCSDDGEPPHTAGRPMLDILQHEELHDVCVVVTRYFGGILLGTGGLVRAYGDAVREGLRNCIVATKAEAVPVTVRTDYNGIGKLQYLTATSGIPVLSTEYAESVTTSLLLSEDDLASFRSAVSDATQGKAVLEFGDPVMYTDVEGEFRVLGPAPSKNQN